MSGTKKTFDYAHKEALFADEAAAYCGMSRALFWRLLKDSRGPKRVIRLSRRPLFLKTDLLEWLMDNAVTLAQEGATVITQEDT